MKPAQLTGKNTFTSSELVTIHTRQLDIQESKNPLFWAAQCSESVSSLIVDQVTELCEMCHRIIPYLLFPFYPQSILALYG